MFSRNSSERRRAELLDTSPWTSTLLLSDRLDENETVIETTDEAPGTTTDEVHATTSAMKRFFVSLLQLLTCLFQKEKSSFDLAGDDFPSL